MSRRGLFLCLDGVDGAGKTTQCQLLAAWLTQQQYTVTLCRDPGSTTVSERIRAILLDKTLTLDAITEALLFMASRAALLDQVVRPALDAGQIVVIDRYIWSTIAYQGHAGTLPLAEVRSFAAHAVRNLLPDLTLILDVPTAVCTTRQSQKHVDRIEAKGPTYLEKVRQGYLAEAACQPARLRVLDATQTVAQVQAAIRHHVDHLLLTWRAPHDLS